MSIPSWQPTPTLDKACELGRAFVTWWFAEIAALRPPLNRLIGGFGSGFAVLALHRERLDLLLPHAPPESQDRGCSSSGTCPSPDVQPLLSRIPSRHSPILIRVAQEYILSRCIHLPLNAKPHLDRILSFEIEKLTPFRSSDVIYTYRTATVTTTHTQLAVNLYIMPRSPLDNVLEAIRHTSLRVRGVELQTTQGPLHLRPDCFSDPHPARPSTSRRLIAVCFNVILIILFLFYLWSALISEQLNRAVDAARADAQVALDEIRHAKLLLEDLRYVRRERSARSLMHMLETLTSALPDHTYLTSLRRDAMSVIIEGVSSDASVIPKSLEDSSIFADVQFISPIRHVADTNKEEFALRATLRISR